MKKIKRILVVILLIVLGLLVGYVVTTCSRLCSNEEENYANATFRNEEKTTVVQFYDISNATIVHNELVFNCTLSKNDEGVLVYTDGTTEHRIVLLANDQIYDCDTKEILYRSVNIWKEE